MAKIIFGSFDDKDDIQPGDDFYIAFLYVRGTACQADRGATYAADTPLTADQFPKGIFLELKTDDIESMSQKISAFGVKVLQCS